jgi:O-antigen/teichoic acid export membrane protein
MRKILYKNSASGIILLILASILMFILVTIFTKYLGVELYGLFSIVSLIGNINIFASFGLNSALIKFISEQGKSKESNLDIVVTLLITCIFLCLLSFLSLYFNGYILLSILNVPFIYLDLSRKLFFCLIISNYFAFLGQTLSAVIDSQQKIFLTNALQMIYNLLYSGSIIVIVLMGYSLDVIGLSILFTSLVWFILITISFFKVWGRLQFEGLKSNFLRVSKKQISYGLKIYTSGLIGLLYEPLTKIIISHFIGIKEVGFFDIALKVRNQLQNLIGKTYYPIYPLIAQTKEYQKLRNIVHDIEQKVFICIPPILSSVLLCSAPFTRIWMGQNSSDLIIDGIIIITSAYLIASFTIIPFYMYLMIKRASITIYIQITNVIANSVVILLIYHILGFYSVYIASSFAITSSFIVSLYYQKKYLNSLIFDSFNQLLKVIFEFIICFISGYVCTLFINDNLLKLILIPIIVTLISILSMRYLKLFKKEDMQRYLGERTSFYNIGVKIFIRK